MSVTIQLPTDVEQRLRAQNPNLDAEAKEAMLVEMFRQERLTRHELAISLGINRFETDAVLKKLYYKNALRVEPGLPQTGWPQ